MIPPKNALEVTVLRARGASGGGLSTARAPTRSVGLEQAEREAGMGKLNGTHASEVKKSDPDRNRTDHAARWVSPKRPGRSARPPPPASRQIDLLRICCSANRRRPSDETTRLPARRHDCAGVHGYFPPGAGAATTQSRQLLSARAGLIRARGRAQGRGQGPIHAAERGVSGHAAHVLG